MAHCSAAQVIKLHLLADPIAYVRASYATWVIAAKAVTKAAAHVLQCVLERSHPPFPPHNPPAMTRCSRYTAVTQIAASTFSKLLV